MPPARAAKPSCHSHGPKEDRSPPRAQISAARNTKPPAMIPAVGMACLPRSRETISTAHHIEIPADATAHSPAADIGSVPLWMSAAIPRHSNAVIPKAAPNPMAAAGKSPLFFKMFPDI